MELLTPELEGELMALSEEDRAVFVFLEEHTELDRHWQVEGFDPGFFRHFEGVIGTKRILTPFSLPAFLERAEEKGIRVVFFEDPQPWLDWAASLMGPPEVKITSHLPNADENGFLPFQVQGYNFLKHLEAGVVQWSTGTGKTVVAAALTAFHALQGNYDVCIWVVKPHNKFNTQASLQALVGMDSIVVDGDAGAREQAYLAAMEPGSILVMNYEKFRDDRENVKDVVADRKVLVIWDEMPTKLKTRGTKLYKSVRDVFYKGSGGGVIKRERMRPSGLIQYMLSATPIENSPEDFFSCMRLLDPEVLGTVTDFGKTYVRTWSPFRMGEPLTFKNLAQMGAKTAHLTHQVDKEDPDIAAQFPKVMEEIILVDLTDDQRKIYDRLIDKILEDGKANDLTEGMMSKIGVAQMLVDNPLAVLRSARSRKKFEDELEAGGFPTKEGSELAMKLVDIIGEKRFGTAGSAKFDALEDVLESLGEGEKAVVFTAFNASMIPLLSEALTTWGYQHVTYKGGMTARAKQDAQDRFREDPDCGIFLSSDAGSDSINLEMASLVVHFDLPWKWSTVVQRQNRIHRITSQFEAVRYISLLAANTIESRKQMIIAAKQGYHGSVFKGAIADQSEAMRLTKQDLLFMLTG